MEEIGLRQYCMQNGKEYLIRQWAVPENKDFDPLKTGFASHKKIWWTCEKGHKWQAMISDRVKKTPVVRTVQTKKPGKDTTILPAPVRSWRLSGIL